MLLVVGLGTFFTAMAGSSVNLALPPMGRELGLELERLRWVVQAFMLTTGSLLVLAGRLGDIVGHRLVYLTGYLLFGLGSLLCGMSGGFISLVVFRVLQAAGGALVLASSPALLTLSFPGRKRGSALGLQATATYLGLTLGPVLGGLLVAALGWRWNFYFFLPTGLVVCLLGYLFLPRRTPQVVNRQFDWAGGASFAGGMCFLLFGLTRLHRMEGWLQSWLLIAAGLGGMFFYWLHSRGRPDAVLPLSLFRSRQFAGAALSAVANYIALFCATFLLPFVLEEGLGRKIQEAGVVLAIQPLVMALVSSPSGWLSDRWGARGLSSLGMLIMGAAIMGMYFSLQKGLGIGELLVWLALIGLGTGVFISPNSSSLMGSAPEGRQGSAGAVLAESRVVGMFLGVALASSIFTVAGGRTGTVWTAQDFHAAALVMLAGAVAAFTGVITSLLRGRRKAQE